MNNNKNIKLQLTKLNPLDVTTHEDLYISILVGLAPKSSLPSAPSGTYEHLYYGYAIEELQKAKQLFCKTFG